MEILLEDNRLQQVVKLVGSDALPPPQQFILFVAELIKNAFLQQNAFDKTDKYCSPEKQIRLLRTLLNFYHKGLELLKSGITVRQITALEIVSEMVRLKSEVPNRELTPFESYGQKLLQGLGSLKAKEQTGGAA